MNVACSREEADALKRARQERRRVGEEMTWSYELDGYWTVAEAKAYPWPCATNTRRTFKLVPCDVLTKNPNGTVTKHNGLCMMNLQVPECDLVRVEAPAHMAVAAGF